MLLADFMVTIGNVTVLILYHTNNLQIRHLSTEDNPDSLRIISEIGYEGFNAVDVVIIITPQGRGTYIELGMAITLGKRVYILFFAPNKTVNWKIDYAIDIAIPLRIGKIPPSLVQPNRCGILPLNFKWNYYSVFQTQTIDGFLAK